MSGERNLLDDVFKAPEHEVRYFSDVMSTPVGSGDLPGLEVSDVERIRSGMADKARAFELTTQATAKVVIQHGWDENDYVWHLEPHRTRRGWQVTVERVIYAIAKTMNEVIPDTVRVNIFKPYAEWEIKSITFKAIDLKLAWQVQDSDIEALNAKLFDVLGALV